LEDVSDASDTSVGAGAVDASIDGDAGAIDASVPSDSGPTDASDETDAGPADASTGVVAGSFDTLRVDLPCLGPGGGYLWTCECASTLQSAVVPVAGDPAARYLVTMRVRGIVELKQYGGGTQGNAQWYEGGSATFNGWNDWKLSAGATSISHYLNSGPGNSIGYSISIDYQATVVVSGGEELTLSVTSEDDVEMMNYSRAAQPMVVPDIVPAPLAFNGQFIQIDFVSAQRL
jgi:hypothetical protein